MKALSEDEGKAAEEALTGVWFGESVDSEMNVTRWIDTAMCFKFHHGDDCVDGTVSGEGISLWRDMRIDFDLVGSFSWRERSVKITKQHKGRFNNRVVYSGKFQLSDNGSPCKIEGTYGKGTIELVKRRGLGANVAGIITNITGDGGGVDFSPSLTQSNSSIAGLVRKYKIFLSGVVVGGVIDAMSQEALAKFRDQHAITDMEHESALHELGLSKAQFNLMKAASFDTGSSEGGLKDGDLCKICFDNRIDAVIIPCGHFAICQICGRKLQECPICRGAIMKIQPIFRT